jgi:hypothetical protein
MSDMTSDLDDQAAGTDGSATASQDAPASSASEAAGSGSAGSGASLTDEQHDWASSFTGMDTRAGSDDGATSAGASPSANGDAPGGFFSGIANAVGSAAGSVVGTVKSAAGAAGDAINTAMQESIDGNAAMMQSVVDAVPLPDSVHDLASGAIDFSKGVAEGAYAGVKGLAGGIVTGAAAVAKEGYALATDENAREQAAEGVLHGAEAVGNFAAEAVTDPSKAAGEMVDAAGQAVDTVEKVATNVYQGYQAAAAQGHGAEFIGKGVGQVGVLVAGAVLTDGASLAGEGAAVAGEGVALAGEGAALLGEGAAVVGEGAAAVGEGAAAVGEGAAVVGEGAAAGAIGEAGAVAGRVGEAGVAVGEAGEVAGEAGAAAGDTGAAAGEVGEGAEASAAGEDAAEADGEAGEGADAADSETERVDPGRPKARVPRSAADQRPTRPLGNIASHDEQGLALRDAAGARTSESEHILSRANIVEQTRNPATGVSPFDKAAYRDATTLKLGRETALEKTIGDNAAARALANSGGAPSAQMLEDSGLESAMNRTLDAAQTTSDTSVTEGGVNLAGHAELGKVFEVGTDDARAFTQGASDAEIDAAVDGMENATVDPRFAAPKGMGIPLRGGAPAADAGGTATADTAGGASTAADAAESASTEQPPSTRIRVADDAAPSNAAGGAE